MKSGDGTNEKMKSELLPLLGKSCRLFVKNLSPEKAIVYSCSVLSVGNRFLRIEDKDGKRVLINLDDIVQVQEPEEMCRQ